MASATGRPGTTGPAGTGQASPARVGDQHENQSGTGDLTLGQLAGKLNAFFYHKKTGLVLILAMAFLCLMGALLEQAPGGVTGNPRSYAQWLASVRPRYGGWTNVLDLLGLFSVFSSIWFKAVTVLLAISIVACTCHRLPQLWQRATRPHVHVTEVFFQHATIGCDFRVDGEAGAVAEHVTAALRHRRYRVLPDERDPGSLYADRFRWAPFGTAIAHASFVIILLGMLVTSQFGFSEDNVAVPVGTTAQLGHDTGLAVHVNSFTDSYYPDGRPSDYVADLTLLRGPAEVARQEVRVNDPLRYDGVSIHQGSFGVAAVMRITGAQGEEVFSGAVPMQYVTDSGASSFGRLALPDQGLEVFVIGAGSGGQASPISAGQVQVDVYRSDSDTALDSRIVDQGTPAQVGGLTVTFERERQFTGLMVSRDPGAILVWIGSGLLVIGTALTMGLKHRRLWIRVSPAGAGTRVRIASADRRDLVFARQVDDLAGDIRSRATEPDRAAGARVK